MPRKTKEFNKLHDSVIKLLDIGITEDTLYEFYTESINSYLLNRKNNKRVIKNVFSNAFNQFDDNFPSNDEMTQRGANGMPLGDF